MSTVSVLPPPLSHPSCPLLKSMVSSLIIATYVHTHMQSCMHFLLFGLLDLIFIIQEKSTSIEKMPQIRLACQQSCGDILFINDGYERAPHTVHGAAPRQIV